MYIYYPKNPCAEYSQYMSIKYIYEPYELYTLKLHFSNSFKMIPYVRYIHRLFFPHLTCCRHPW